MATVVHKTVIDLTQLKGLTRKEAREYISKEVKQGTVIGVSGKPSAAHTEGIYLMTVSRDASTSYHRVGDA